MRTLIAIAASMMAAGSANADELNPAPKERMPIEVKASIASGIEDFQSWSGSRLSHAAKRTFTREMHRLAQQPNSARVRSIDHSIGYTLAKADISMTAREHRQPSNRLAYGKVDNRDMNKSFRALSSLARK